MTESTADSSAWYESAFDALYLMLYAHRNNKDAARAMDFLRAHVDIDGARRIFDLCCGAGRHLAQMKLSGPRAIGLDLSKPLLDKAQQDLSAQSLSPCLVRGSMDRLPFVGAFDLILNMFTSFAYFDDDARNQRVLDGVADALAPGGLFVMDFLNSEWVRSNLQSGISDDEIRGMKLRIHREISGDPPRVWKRTRILCEPDSREIVESVRLYHRDDLTDMFERAGLCVLNAWGDFDGSAWSDAAPRCILLAERAA